MTITLGAISGVAVRNCELLGIGIDLTAGGGSPRIVSSSNAKTAVGKMEAFSVSERLLEFLKCPEEKILRCTERSND